MQNRSNINVTLQEDFKELNEVVVTALGVAREQKTLVYSAQTVKADTAYRSAGSGTTF